MKNIFKVMLGATMLTAATAMATVNYPFPQNKANPYGYTIPYASTAMIKEHFKTWMSTWYSDRGDGTAWVLSPEGTSSTVSEGIAYGMLLMVYMSDAQNDYQSQFDKLYKTWTNNAVTTNGGMNWRVGTSAGTGSASDADFDAALALIMAYKQWGNSSYLTAAQNLLTWIRSNDLNGSHIKPGNAWNDAFNPSYATTASFQVFKYVDQSGSSTWSSVMSTAASDLKACQNSTSGLVPDWCDWNSHQAVLTSASVSQSAAGYYDDAARTPWRMAWAYYWFGNSDAQTFNTKLANWVVPTSLTASNTIAGYYVDGTETSLADRKFVASTFAGGFGLAATSVGTDDANSYVETAYKVLKSLTSCTSAANCGTTDGGEKYYPSTLNILYLLLMSGNMPNLYDMTGFTAFTPDTTLMRSSDSGIDGIQQTRGDTTVGVSGFWNWGAYHDKYAECGTKMTPDSGESPLYYHDGAIYAEALMEIGPEPTWTQEAADAGTLKYPSAGIAMSFLKDDTKGVDFTALGIKYLRVTYKSEGPIRIAILNEATAEAGGEPGAYLTPSSAYTSVTYDLTPCDLGFGPASSCSDGAVLDILTWVDQSKAPTGDEILKVVKGLKFEVKDSKGGYGSISVKAVEFLDASQQVVDPVKIVGFAVGSGSSASSGTGTGDQQSIATPAMLSMAKIATSGMNITVSGAQMGTDIAVFNMQGKVIASTKAIFGAQSITVPNKGLYMVRVGNKISKVTVK